jgi:hypothetical protein
VDVDKVQHWDSRGHFFAACAEGTEELYDHEQDPHEWDNLAADRQHAAIRARFAKALPPPQPEGAPRKE